MLMKNTKACLILLLAISLVLGACKHNELNFLKKITQFQIINGIIILLQKAVLTLLTPSALIISILY
jgi:hypothetical protein